MVNVNRTSRQHNPTWLKKGCFSFVLDGRGLIYDMLRKSNFEGQKGKRKNAHQGATYLHNPKMSLYEEQINNQHIHPLGFHTENTCKDQKHYYYIIITMIVV